MKDLPPNLLSTATFASRYNRPCKHTTKKPSSDRPHVVSPHRQPIVNGTQTAYFSPLSRNPFPSLPFPVFASSSRQKLGEEPGGPHGIVPKPPPCGVFCFTPPPPPLAWRLHVGDATTAVYRAGRRFPALCSLICRAPLPSSPLASRRAPSPGGCRSPGGSPSGTSRGPCTAPHAHREGAKTTDPPPWSCVVVVCAEPFVQSESLTRQCIPDIGVSCLTLHVQQQFREKIVLPTRPLSGLD